MRVAYDRPKYTSNFRAATQHLSVANARRKQMQRKVPVPRKLSETVVISLKRVYWVTRDSEKKIFHTVAITI